MLQVQTILAIDDQRLLPYRTMKQQRDHRQQRIFVAEGEKVVRRLLESELPVVSALMPEKWLSELETLIRSRPEIIHVYVAEKAQLEKLTGFSMYQGVLAVGRVPDPVAADAVLKTSPQPRLFVAADGINNSENIGVLARNCSAFGVQALLIGETSSSPYMRRAVRTSMGTIFRLPVVETTDLVQSLRQLRKRGVRCIAAHPHTDQRTLSQADLATDCCMVFGSEGFGISPAVRETCDEAVAVPMHGSVDSLNVGSAVAVFLYEANRQRGKV